MRRFRGRVGAIGFGLLVLAGVSGVTVRTVAQDPSLFRTGTEDSKTPSKTPVPAPAAPALPTVRPPTASSSQPASPQPAPAAPSVSGSPAPGRSVDPRVVERITVDKAERSGGASTPAPRASVNPEPGARDAAIGVVGGAKAGGAAAAPSAANGIKEEEASRAMKELGVGRMGTPAPDPESEESKLAEIKGLVKATRKTMEEGKAELADRYLESIVAVQMPDAAKKAALREVAELYESHGDRVKAAAIYEKLCTLMENDTEMPLWLVKLGVLYREVGAYQLAISRFYGVINMAIKVGGRDFESQQGIARKAQREIADTHFLKGDFEQAQKFYNMALRSELSKEDRAMMLFRAGHCTFMRDDPAGAVAIFERFLKDYPQHPSSPEARYMLASAYRVQNRPQESFDTVMDLLRGVQSKRDADPKVWAFWQKKAGNEFANEFYQRGEFVNAVTIYQALAALAETPEWRWPVVYQMGLCFERLGLKPRATEAYQYILGEAEKPEVKERALPESLQSLTEMAKWRLEHLSWDDGVRATLRLLTGPEIK